MTSQSNGDKLREAYKKALLTSLLSLSKEEEDSLRGPLRPEEPTGSGQPTSSKTRPFASPSEPGPEAPPPPQE